VNNETNYGIEILLYLKLITVNYLQCNIRSETNSGSKTGHLS